MTADGGSCPASGTPLDRDIYEMTRDEMRKMRIRTTPGSLGTGPSPTTLLKILDPRRTTLS